MATITSAITMVTNPSIAEIMEKPHQEEIKVGFPFSELQLLSLWSFRKTLQGVGTS